MKSALLSGCSGPVDRSDFGAKSADPAADTKRVSAPQGRFVGPTPREGEVQQCRLTARRNRLSPRADPAAADRADDAGPGGLRPRLADRRHVPRGDRGHGRRQSPGCGGYPPASGGGEAPHRGRPGRDGRDGRPGRQGCRAASADRPGGCRRRAAQPELWQLVCRGRQPPGVVPRQARRRGARPRGRRRRCCGSTAPAAASRPATSWPRSCAGSRPRPASRSSPA